MIASLIDENSKEITNQDEILKYMGTFYTRLYSFTNEKGRNIDEFLNKIPLENILNDTKKCN